MGAIEKGPSWFEEMTASILVFLRGKYVPIFEESDIKECSFVKRTTRKCLVSEIVGSYTCLAYAAGKNTLSST